MRELLFLFISVTIFVSCSRGGSGPAEHGGQDGGGGHVARSTPAQVHKALNFALQLAVDTDAWNSVFAEFAEPVAIKIISFPQYKGLHLQHVFPEPAFERDGILTHKKAHYSSPYTEALGRNRIVIKETGDCGSAKDNHADASVSAFNLNADICFSIENLTRVPEDLLLREILALILHEVSHLGGADEVEAQLWQETYRDYFMQRFGVVRPGESLRLTLGKFEEATQLIEKAVEWDEKHPSDSRVYGLLGKLEQTLREFPDVRDNLRLQLALSPAKPWLIENYTMSISTLAENISQNFAVDAFSLNDKVRKAPKGKKRTEIIKRVASDLKRLRATYAVLSGDSEAIKGISPEDLKPSCVQPDFEPKYTCRADVPPQKP